MNRSTTLLAASLITAVTAASASAAFTPYIIRGTPLIQTNNVYVPGATEFDISASGMKAALGSNNLTGSTIGSVSNVTINRHDNSGRFTAGSGAAVAPYFNIWVTDGINYAVIANEPSNPSFAAFRTAGPNGSFTYSFSMTDIAGEAAKVYETAGAGSLNSWVHVALNKVGQNLTFADVAGLTIGAPNAAYIAANPGTIGTGAPRELGSNVAYSFNWVFGDTLANYVNDQEGYVVSGASKIPAPGAAALLGLGGLLAARRRR